jgi:hypothetical protein
MKPLAGIREGLLAISPRAMLDISIAGELPKRDTDKVRLAKVKLEFGNTPYNLCPYLVLFAPLVAETSASLSGTGRGVATSRSYLASSHAGNFSFASIRPSPTAAALASPLPPLMALGFRVR